MPTRKQRKRIQKERRHEYETVWVDGEGNELEEPPEEAPAPVRERRADTKKPQQKRQPQRSSRTGRPDPLPPSWRRASKRSLILGAVVFAFFGFVQRNVVAGLSLAVIYTALFIPFTYGLDRFAYRRWQRRNGQLPPKTKR